MNEYGERIDDLDVDMIASTSTDSLLESLSLDILGDAINQQIASDVNPGRDFLETVVEKFNTIVDHAEPDAVRGIKHEMVDWANRLVLSIISRYNLGYNNPDDESLDILDILESLYHFFVLDRHDNTVNFFIQYIECNKRTIVESMGIGGRSGDITTIANKKKNINKNNIPILSNLDEVIRYVASSAGVSTEEFLSTIDDGSLYTANVQSYFDCDMIVGDFFSEYVSSELGNYTDDISTDLRSSIRTNLMNI